MSRISGIEAVAKAQLELLADSRRELAIRADNLSNLPHSDELADALVRLIKGYKQSRVRVLYNQLGDALDNGHLLIQLRRRLPSYVALRQADERDQGSKAQWWLGDRFQLLTLDDETKPQALLDLFAKAQGPAHLEQFEREWNSASEDPHVREVLI